MFLGDKDVNSGGVAVPDLLGPSIGDGDNNQVLSIGLQ